MSKVKITYYLDVISSWCYYAEDTWAFLKGTYADEVSFDWKVALIPAEGFPATAAEEDWYYKRSGSVTHWPKMLNSAWVEPGRTDYLPPNAVAEACKDFSITDDVARLAITRAAVEDGRKVADWNVSVDVACEACPELDPSLLLQAAKSDEVLMRLKVSSKAFDSLQINQRPGFLLESEIGDRAVFSGLIKKEPLVATIDCMLHDVRAYRSFHSHFGDTVPGE